MRVGLGIILYRLWSPAVGISFSEYGVYRRTLDFRISIFRILVIGDVVPCGLKLSYSCLQLGYGSRDIGKLYYVRLGGLGQFAELGEGILDPLVVSEVFRKVCKNASGERNIPSLDVHARSLRKSFDNRKQRISGESGSLVGLGVDDGWGRHKI